jgi:hypothetical protein
MNLSKLFQVTPRQRERWQQQRAKGKKHFVIYRGILGWGGIMFVSMSALDYYSLFGWTLTFDSAYASKLVLNLILWPVAGLVWGIWVWESLERRMVDIDSSQTKSFPSNNPV